MGDFFQRVTDTDLEENDALRYLVIARQSESLLCWVGFIRED